MRRLVVRLLDDPDAVEDEVQETWVRALEQPPRAADELHSLRKWLHTVARRLATRRNMSEAARRRREAAVAYQAQVASSGEEGALGAERLRQQRELAGHVLALEEPYRTAVILRYQEGLSPTKLAKRLGISNAAGRQRVSRGLAKLRQRLDRQHGTRSAWNAAFALLALRPGPLGPPSPVAVTNAAVGVAGILVVVTGTWALLDHPAVASLPQEAGRKPREVAGMEAGAGAPAERVELAEPSLLAELDRMLDLHGVVVDPSARPVEGALVEALPPDRSGVSLLGRRLGDPGFAGLATRNNRRGEFKLRLAAGWSVDLRVAQNPFATVLLPDLRPGERVRVELQPAIRLRGRITRKTDGRPIGAARLRLSRLYRGNSRFRETARCSTDRAGGYSFAGLSAGRYVLDIAAAGASDRRVVLDLGQDRSAAVRDLELDAGLPVKGTVVDAVSGERIAGARVVAAPSFSQHDMLDRVYIDPEFVGLGWSSHAAVRTDALGDFEIVAPAGLMPPRIVVLADGYARLQQRIDAPADERLQISLEHGHSVT